MSCFLDEVRENVEFRELLKKNPSMAVALFLNFASRYEKEWADFLEERDTKRQQYRFTKYSCTKDFTFREIACYPPMVGEWLKFLNKGNESDKVFVKNWLKQHPEYWVVDSL